MFRFSGSLDLKADKWISGRCSIELLPARSGLFYASGALNSNDTQDLPFLPPASAALVLSSQDKYEQAKAMHRQKHSVHPCQARSTGYLRLLESIWDLYLLCLSSWSAGGESETYGNEGGNLHKM